MSVSNCGLWLLVKDANLTLLVNVFFLQLMNAITKKISGRVVTVVTYVLFFNEIVRFRLCWSNLENKLMFFFCSFVAYMLPTIHW